MEEIRRMQATRIECPAATAVD